ncbi:hypothetical protein ACFO5R_22635 [Halosolutus amylolyticus]|uniref:DUF7344 domain-containing protein n=1 Tax=Halosolutus amylolyticus TaxID=2932267 RepID=A0ABD5PW99_9EURY|nr:hypothetical protein [Halosolutus amylolyticus]
MVVCTVAEVAVAVAALVDEVAVYALQSTGVLGHPVRRRVVSVLIEHDILRREEVAEMLADDETIAQSDPDRIELMLHHQHLPHLDEELFVEYDHRTGDVVLWKDPAVAADLVDSA